VLGSRVLHVARRGNIRRNTLCYWRPTGASKQVFWPNFYRTSERLKNKQSEKRAGQTPEMPGAAAGSNCRDARERLSQEAQMPRSADARKRPLFALRV
jgi:hypothetical protein